MSACLGSDSVRRSQGNTYRSCVSISCTLFSSQRLLLFLLFLRYCASDPLLHNPLCSLPSRVQERSFFYLVVSCGGSTLLSDTLSDTLSFNMSRRNCHLGQGSEAKTTHESVRLCDRCRCCERQRASVE